MLDSTPHGRTMDTEESAQGHCPQVRPGGEVPCDLYAKHTPGLWTEPGAKQCSLTRGAVLEVPVTVERAGAVLDWCFQSKSNDLCFGLSFRSGGQSSSEVLPLRKVNCTMFPESGQLECQEPGICKLPSVSPLQCGCASQRCGAFVLQSGLSFF